MISSYIILPEGILRGKHPIVNLLEFSSNIWISTLRIFSYNLIFTALTIASSLIAQKSKIVSNKYIPISYLAFWGLMLNFGIIIGTWSFELNRPTETFTKRLIHTFDIYHNSGLLEILAYLLVAAVSYKFTLWYSDGKKIVLSKKLKDIKLYKAEKIILIIAFILLFLGALLESYWIVNSIG
jgi:hypothetical protein